MESSPWLSTSEPTMKPITAIVADEMFPEGAGFGMDLEDVSIKLSPFHPLVSNYYYLNDSLGTLNFSIPFYDWY